MCAQAAGWTRQGAMIVVLDKPVTNRIPSVTQKSTSHQMLFAVACRDREPYKVTRMLPRTRQLTKSTTVFVMAARNAQRAGQRMTHFYGILQRRCFVADPRRRSTPTIGTLIVTISTIRNAGPIAELVSGPTLSMTLTKEVPPKLGAVALPAKSKSSPGGSAAIEPTKTCAENTAETASVLGLPMNRTLESVKVHAGAKTGGEEKLNRV